MSFIVPYLNFGGGGGGGGGGGVDVLAVVLKWGNNSIRSSKLRTKPLLLLKNTFLIITKSHYKV